MLGSAAGAETAANVPKVGLLFLGPMGQCILSQDFLDAFARRGYVEGKTISFERHPLGDRPDLLPATVDEMVAHHVDLIVTCGYPPAAVAQSRAPDTPIVVVSAGDPIETGMVESLAHPGGHVTGVSQLSTLLSSKRLQLLKEAVPEIHTVAMLWNEGDLAMQMRCNAVQAEAKKLGLVAELLPVRAPDNFKIAFAEMDRNPPDAILMVADALTVSNHQLVFDYAAAHKIPDMEEINSLAHAGGLMAYGPDQVESFERVAELSDRILRGAKAGDLPLELPSRFRFTVNLKTARGLGLAIPEATIERADDVVE
jgi:putative ABC transport system substrate-binding protein